MAQTDAVNLKKTLQRFGFSNAAIDAAWPDWWSADAEASTSARAELRFSLSRKLGLDPSSLLKEGRPQFIWRDEAKFKRFTGTGVEGAALASFGMSIGRALVSSTAEATVPLAQLAPQDIRSAILKESEYVDLGALISFCWAVGVPVVQLRVFPLTAKRMCAMSVNWNGRFAVMLGQSTSYPAQMAFYLAHELAHICLGHVADGGAVVDVDDVLRAREGGEQYDIEEAQADQFALELLTGQAELSVRPTAEQFIAPQLAEVAATAGRNLRIDPGTLILCLGHSTQKWPQVFAALNRLGAVKEMWRQINEIAYQQVQGTLFLGDYGDFIRTVLELGDDSSRARQ